MKAQDRIRALTRSVSHGKPISAAELRRRNPRVAERIAGEIDANMDALVAAIADKTQGKGMVKQIVIGTYTRIADGAVVETEHLVECADAASMNRFIEQGDLAKTLQRRAKRYGKRLVSIRRKGA